MQSFDDFKVSYGYCVTNHSNTTVNKREAGFSFDEHVGFFKNIHISMK